MIMYINKNTGEFTFHKLVAEVWEMFGEEITIQIVTCPF